MQTGAMHGKRVNQKSSLVGIQNNAIIQRISKRVVNVQARSNRAKSEAQGKYRRIVKVHVQGQQQGSI